jgi:hypothetical protein
VPVGLIGDNGLCWNADGDFATLAQGEGCELQLTAAGDVGDTIEGDLDLELNGGQAHVRLTTFDSEFVAESTLPPQMTVDNGAGGEITFTPNQDITIEVTNDSDSVALNNVIIDLSNMPQAIIDEINFNGIAWVIADKIILLNAIAPEASKTVDLGLSNDAEQALLDNYDDLLNNATTELLVIRSGNAQSVVPDIIVNVTPIEGDTDTLTLDDPDNSVDYTISNLSSGSITYDSITTDSLPDGVTVPEDGNGCADDLPMQTLTPKDTANDSCTITLEVASTSTGGDGNLIVNFTDESGTEIPLQPTVSVTNTTTASVSNNFTNALLVARATADQNPLTTEVQINNTGEFDIQNLSASITNGAGNGLSVVTAGINNPCTLAGVLAQGDSCNIGIQSNNGTADLGFPYTLTITGDNISNTGEFFTLTDFSQALISSGDLTDPNEFTEASQTKTVTLNNTLPAIDTTITLNIIDLDPDLTNGGLINAGGCPVGSQIDGNNGTCNLMLTTDTTAPAEYIGNVTVTYTDDTTGEQDSLTIAVEVDVPPVIADGNACEAGTSINYFLPQTGQTPTSPIISLTNPIDGQERAGCGVPWAYNGSQALEPTTRFELGTGAEADCIIDNLTGLMWPQNANAYNGGNNYQDWDAALSGVDSFSYCGHNDWRLPNLNEISSLINYAESTPAVWLNVDPNGDGSNVGFDNVTAENYWSSSTYAPDTVLAWYVGMYSGEVYRFDKGSNEFYKVLPVRTNTSNAPAKVIQTGQTPSSPADVSAMLGPDGVACENASQEAVGCGVPWAYNGGNAKEPVTRFTQVTTGCSPGEFMIQDNLTGLVWIGDANNYNAGSAQPWSNGLTDLHSFSYCGHNDWRMPNIVELKSLLNLGQIVQADWLNDPNAVLNDGSAAFMNIMPDLYWSSSIFAPDTSLAWVVNMNDGDMWYFTSARVLPVRGPLDN